MSNKCVTCNGKTAVVDSRDGLSKARRRRRVCLNCGARATTYEVTEDQWKNFISIKSSAELIREHLNFIIANTQELEL